MLNIDTISKAANIRPENILNMYLYGSRVYKCNNDQSDFDVIAVCNVGEAVKDVRENNLDITVYNIYEFEKQISKHEISVLECLFLPEDCIIKQDKKFDFVLSLPLLRCSISAKSSNSFVKAKKKMTVEKDLDLYVGQKSLFHCLRIIKFGTQIAKYRKIIDYTEANNYWNEMMFDSIITWELYKKRYQPIYNSLMTEFRKLAPKE